MSGWFLIKCVAILNDPGIELKIIMLKKIPCSVFCSLLLFMVMVSPAKAWHLNSEQLKKSQSFQLLQTLPESSLLIENALGKTIYSRYPNTPRIPASTTKLLTALLALEHWGRNHHFATEFYFQPSSQSSIQLWIKGLGDPFLVSEELRIIAQMIGQALHSQGVTQIDAMILDSSFYQTQIEMPGRGLSDNPYDAIPTAIAVNFNTAFVGFDGQHWSSAEDQTPLTQVAIAQAKNQFLPAGKDSQSLKKSIAPFKQRINLGFNPKTNEKNLAQLLVAFLQDQNLKVGNQLEWKTLPAGQNWQKMRYQNSHSLKEVVAPMLKYSTNFIANQLSLNLAAETYNLPAGETLMANYFEKQLAALGLQGKFIEGAGLSRDNRISAQELMKVVKWFAPYKDLLPEVKSGIWAKSGTLNGVTTLAGFIEKESEYLPFVLMVNQPAGYGFRNQLLVEIRNALQR